ncbi:MAG: hypothetical protein WB952_24890 [Terriglobales bacterium]
MSEIKNPLDAAIAHLEGQKADIETLIQNIKRFRDSGGLPPIPNSGEPLAISASGSSASTTRIPSDAFFKMTIADAAIKFLRKWADHAPQPTKAIIAALDRGGIKGKNYQTVYKILTRRAKEKGDVVNVHGDWGLQEWYENLKSEPIKQE